MITEDGQSYVAFRKHAGVAVALGDPDAMAAWRRGDEGVMRALAQLELKSSGVRLREE